LEDSTLKRWDRLRGSLTEPFTPKFTLGQLKKLPADRQLEGAELKKVYTGFKNVASYLLNYLGVPLTCTYDRYLRHELVSNFKYVEATLDKIQPKESAEHRSRWIFVSYKLALDAIYVGHWKIEEAHICLKQEDTTEFARYLAEAGVYFGRLTLIADLCQLDVYDQIGSIQSAKAGASIGGRRSGETRRKQSKVPTPIALRLEKERMVNQGKPSRDVSAILAKKYNCTTDHIRKLLKRE
jgi:hypothetical protein